LAPTHRRGAYTAQQVNPCDHTFLWAEFSVE